MFFRKVGTFDEKSLLDKDLEENKFEGAIPCQKDTVMVVDELEEFRHREEEPHEQVAEDADNTAVEQQKKYSIARGRESINQ